MKRTPPIWKSDKGELVEAWTKSEARAIIKKQRGVMKLPVGMKITCVKKAEPKTA